MKNLLFISLLMASSFNCKSQKNMKIVYVYDALCGWCYGFSPVMTQFQEKYKDSLDFEVISGGMITGDRIGAIGEVAGYISWAYKDVEKATGVKFGSDFLDKTLKEGSAIFTSIPLSIALSIFKETDTTGNSVLFAAELQKAIYYDGLEPKDLQGYGKIASKFEIDSANFVEKMKEPKYRKLAEADFEKSSTFGVTGFPTIFIEVEGKYHKIGSGYMPMSQLESNYLRIKNTIK